MEALVSIIVNPERDAVLLFKRADNKLFGKNLFAPVAAGPYQSGEDFKQRAIEETKAETGIEGKFLLEAPAQNLPLEGKMITVHPFVFEVAQDSPVVLNEEHTEYRWVPLGELSQPEYHPFLGPGIFMLLNLIK